MATIVVVEDDVEQLEDMLLFLKHCQHRALGAVSAAQMEELLRQGAPDVVLLDYNLPDSDGPTLAAGLRQRYGVMVGIVMITARGMIADRLDCRRAGADDYLVKPVDFEELQAILDNLLARLDKTVALPARDEAIWELDLTRARLLPPSGEGVQLTLYECRLLQTLASEPEQLASRPALVAAIGKNSEVYDTRALEVMISRLRKKLPAAADGRAPLQAARGEGYKFLFPLVVHS